MQKTLYSRGLSKLNRIRKNMVRGWYLLQSRIIFRAVQAPCVLCGGVSFNKLAEGNRYGFPLTVYTCTSCGMSMQQPYPTDSFLKEFYAKDIYRGLYWGTHIQSLADREKRRKFMANRLDYLNRKAELRDKKILDYGAGTRVLSEMALPYAATVHEVEVTDTVKDKYEIIVSLNVLEHLHDPLQTLSMLRTHLKSNGYLFIEVPDTTVRTAKKHFHIAHITYFTQPTLRSMLEKAGYTVIDEGVFPNEKTIFALAT